MYVQGDALSTLGRVVRSCRMPLGGGAAPSRPVNPEAAGSSPPPGRHSNSIRDGGLGWLFTSTNPILYLPSQLARTLLGPNHAPRSVLI